MYSAQHKNKNKISSTHKTLSALCWPLSRSAFKFTVKFEELQWPWQIPKSYDLTCNLVMNNQYLPVVSNICGRSASSSLTRFPDPLAYGSGSGHLASCSYKYFGEKEAILRLKMRAIRPDPGKFLVLFLCFWSRMRQFRGQGDQIRARSCQPVGTCGRGGLAEL